MNVINLAVEKQKRLANKKRNDAYERFNEAYGFTKEEIKHSSQNGIYTIEDIERFLLENFSEH